MRQLVAENSHRRAETAGQTLSERSACKQINITNQQQQEANISMKMRSTGIHFRPRPVWVHIVLPITADHAHSHLPQV